MWFLLRVEVRWTLGVWPRAMVVSCRIWKTAFTCDAGMAYADSGSAGCDVESKKAPSTDRLGAVDDIFWRALELFPSCDRYLRYWNLQSLLL